MNDRYNELEDMTLIERLMSAARTSEMETNFSDTAAIREAIAALSWQPIETAPKDGTLILAINQAGLMDVCHWWEEIGWINNSFDSPDCELTHWRPLPPPPTS